MRTGAVSEQPVFGLLAELVASRASGGLELGDGKRRWNLWFEAGRVVGSRSNLKSEATATLAERHPGVPPEALAALQGEARVRNLLRLAEGSYTFTPGEAPPQRAPLDLPALLWGALQAGVVPTEPLDALLSPPDTRPRLASGGLALSALGLPPELNAVLCDLDGERTLQDVLDFAPTPPEQTRQALALAVALGVARLSAEPAPEVHVNPAADPLSALFNDVFTAAPTVQLQKADPEVERLHEESGRIGGAETHFEVLGLPWDSPPGEFRRAYMRLAQQLHPDRWVNRPPELAEEAARAFARLGEAWEVLGEEEARQAYIDRVVHGKKTEDELAMEKLQDIMDAENLFKAGMAEFNAGRLVTAHEHFRGAHQKLPEEHEFAAFYGYTTFRIHHGKDDLSANQGRQLVRESVEKGTKLHNGWALMGMIYAAEGEAELAKKSLLAALKLSPTNPLAQRELKRLMRQEETRKEAEKPSGIGGFFNKLFGRK